MSKKKNNKRKQKSTLFYKILSFLLIIVAVICDGMIFYFNILPLKYFIPGSLILWAITLIIVVKLNVKTKLLSKIITIFFSLVLIVVEAFGISYALGTLTFMHKIFDTGFQTENFNVYVLKDSDYKRLKDLEDKFITIYDNESSVLNTAIDKLNKKLDYKEKKETDLEATVQNLLEDKTDAIFISETLMNIFAEEHQSELSNLKVIATIPVLIKKTTGLKKVDVTNDSFIVYLSGIDSYGSIKNVSRSDVNLLLAVNPKKEKILLINTPRDYYVTLATKNKKDKLTHAGIYGIEESVKSLELLYNIDVNYYIRVNFTSFMNIIDTLGGITAYSDYSFNYDGYRFSKGPNKLSAASALAFSRARKMLPEGDISRGHNQQAVIEGIINKATDISVLTKYNTLLKKLESGVITNIDQKTISKIVNAQLDKNIKWDFETFSVTGSDSNNITYSTGSYKVYVMEPNLSSVNEVKVKIQSLINK